MLANNDPRTASRGYHERSEAIAEARRRNRRWDREHSEGETRDSVWYSREVAPYLDDMPLSAIAQATGLSLTACSRYRAGTRTPHPRHWDALLALVKEKQG